MNMVLVGPVVVVIDLCQKLYLQLKLIEMNHRQWFVPVGIRPGRHRRRWICVEQ